MYCGVSAVPGKGGVQVAIELRLERVSGDPIQLCVGQDARGYDSGLAAIALKMGVENGGDQNPVTFHGRGVYDKVLEHLRRGGGERFGRKLRLHRVGEAVEVEGAARAVPAHGAAHVAHKVHGERRDVEAVLALERGAAVARAVQSPLRRQVVEADGLDVLVHDAACAVGAGVEEHEALAAVLGLEHHKVGVGWRGFGDQSVLFDCPPAVLNEPLKPQF